MSNYRIPVVLIHSGDSPYLPATIFQLRHSNPRTPIYLIGDDENRHYNSWVSHHEINDFLGHAKAFENIYQHFSTNGRAFELICIQRWFILRDFMKAMNFPGCLYLDSDVLVYSEVETLQDRLRDFAMTVTGISAHTNFISDWNVLNHFCEFIRQAYENEKVDHTLARRYAEFLKLYPEGGISDMTFFTDYRKSYPGKIADLSIISDGCVFDITLDTILDFASSNGLKRIIWKNNIPHSENLKTKELVRFHTLHFQGKCKENIYDFVTYPMTRFVLSVYLRTAYYFRKIVRRIS